MPKIYGAKAPLPLPDAHAYKKAENRKKKHRGATKAMGLRNKQIDFVQSRLILTFV